MTDSDEYPRAVVREINGQLVLDDPDALAVINAVRARNRGIDRDNCERTYNQQLDRVKHFVHRCVELQKDPKDVVITIINVDDPFGRPLADALMPGFDWTEARAGGRTPYARGLASRKGVEEYLWIFDALMAAELAQHPGLAVVVIDYTVARIFNAPGI